MELETQHLQEYDELNRQVEDPQEIVVNRSHAQTAQRAVVVHVDGRSRFRKAWDSIMGSFSCFKGSKD